MKKTYYVESKKNFEADLAVLNEELYDMSDEAVDAIASLLGKLGFDYDGHEFSMPEIYSVWDVRAYSKKLVVKKDLINFIENNTSLDMDDISEEDIENAVDCISHHPDYGQHLHQADYILISGVEYLEDVLDDRMEDDDTEEEDECADCSGCMKTGRKNSDDGIQATIVFSTVGAPEPEPIKKKEKEGKSKDAAIQAIVDLINELVD